MNFAKIRLSEEEQLLISDPTWILTKNRILEQVSLFLGQVHEQQLDWLKSAGLYLAENRYKHPAKLSKGENYLGLPYRVLDFPRCFEGEHVFAIRTMCWWGHFFSVTFQVSGHYKTEREDRLVSAREVFIDRNTFMCMDTDPWQHHFTDNYYQPVEKISREVFEQRIRSGPFVKLACKHKMSGWEDLPSRLLEDFRMFVKAAG